MKKIILLTRIFIFLLFNTNEIYAQNIDKRILEKAKQTVLQKEAGVWENSSQAEYYLFGRKCCDWIGKYQTYKNAKYEGEILSFQGDDNATEKGRANKGGVEFVKI